MNYLYAFALLLCLNGCKTLEQRCIERFPSEVKTEVRTQVVTDTLILPDTFIEYLDTTLCPPGLTDTLVIIKERIRSIPGDTIVVETICTDTVMVANDAARVAYLVADNSKLMTQLTDAKRSARDQLWTVSIVAGLVVLALAGFILLRK